MRNWIKCVVAAGRHGFVRKERGDGGAGGDEGEIDSAEQASKSTTCTISSETTTERISQVTCRRRHETHHVAVS